MDEQAIRAEIAQLRREIRERIDRSAHLQRLLSTPRVTPVLHYMQHFSEEEEAWDLGDLESAFRHLDYMADMNIGAPLGVSVGGAFFSFEEWQPAPRGVSA